MRTQEAFYVADLNTLPVRPVVRQPRALVRVNDEILHGWVDWDVEQNSFYSADTFTVRFALSQLPPERGMKWLSQQQLLYVEIFAGFPPDSISFSESDLDSLIYGRVDDLSYDPVSRSVSLSGRDFTSLLIDTKSTAQNQNKTASEIAIAIAEENGLTPVVTTTTGLVGQYYQIDHVNLLDERSDWDWLTYFAGVEGFRAYVKGKELHFEPDPEQSDAYVIRWEPGEFDQANVSRLSFTRSLTVAKGVTVVVKSWNAKQKAGFSVSYPQSARSIRPGRAKVGNERITYTFTVAGKTREQAQDIAERKHREITLHEKRLEADLPGDNLMDRNKLIRVEGTDTDFDQIYYPMSIVRTMSFGGGYTMHVSAKNSSPEPVL